MTRHFVEKIRNISKGRQYLVVIAVGASLAGCAPHPKSTETISASNSASGHGVTSSDLSGAVTGKDGAPVEGASVVAVHDSTGKRYSATTRSTGQYTVSGLVAGGPYTITATGAGFSSAEMKDVYITPGATGSVALILETEATSNEAVPTSGVRPKSLDTGPVETGPSFAEGQKGPIKTNPPEVALSPAKSGDAPNKVSIIPTSSTALIDDILKALDWGNIAFNAPQAMSYGVPKRVELLISPSLSQAELQAQLQQQSGAETAHVRFSNRMEGQLTGQGFAILALDPGLQAVTSLQPTHWRWDVTPKEQGEQALHLTLSAHFEVAGSDTPFVVRTFDREILVNVSIGQHVSGFILNNWQWLWATVAVPIAGYLWRRWKKKAHAPHHR